MANERKTPGKAPDEPGPDVPKTPHPDRERRIGDPETDRPEIESGGDNPGPRPNEQRTRQGGEGRTNPQNPAQDPERRTSTDRTGNR